MNVGDIVEYRGRAHEVLLLMGSVTVVPESGCVYEIGPDGVEYDLTDYQIKEGVMVRDLETSEEVMTTLDFIKIK